MDKAINGWTVLLVVILVAMGYAFGIYHTRTFLPAAAAQIAANKKVVTDVDKAYGNLITQVNTAFAKMDERVTSLEKKK